MFKLQKMTSYQATLARAGVLPTDGIFPIEYPAMRALNDYRVNIR